MDKRTSGILLHISSLPSPFGIGDLGQEAYRFVDFLKESGQSQWQILPLNPTDIAMGNCPYSSCSAFASNILFISPEKLVEQGFLPAEHLKKAPVFPSEHVHYQAVIPYKMSVLDHAFTHYGPRLAKDNEFRAFCQKTGSWLNDYSLFIALKQYFQGAPWYRWPQDIHTRRPEAIQKYTKELDGPILRQKFFQYLFFKQWSELKKYCKAKGVMIIGDLPIYVQHDSVDVWANPSIFKLDESGRLLFLAGVPPDYFSETGQLWGNPVYDWDELKETGYGWWRDRLAQNLSLFDIVRIDHFRGFVNFWQVPQGETTAVNGSWVQAPAKDFFNKMLKHFADFPIIAEDLGFLTDDVKELIKRYKFPGMKILLFAFDSDDENPYLPHNHIKNCVVYTGTHDNNTAKGWFRQEATDHIKQKMREVLQEEPAPETVAWQLVTLASNSIANTVILPMQDVLGLDETCRMNIPGTIDNNWQWRLLPEQPASSLAKKLFKLTKENQRT